MSRSLRNSGVELLRILAMLQIIFLHFFAYAGYSDVLTRLSAEYTDVARFIWAFARMPVDVFLIISGYFMVNATFDLKKNMKKAGRIYLQMFVYSIAIVAGFWFLKPNSHNISMLKYFFPLLSRNWYFIDLYLIVLVLSPFINKAIRDITQKQYLFLLGVCLFLFSIWTSMTYIYPTNVVVGLNRVISNQLGKSLYFFIFMYLIGGYIRRFIPEHHRPRWRYLVLFVGTCLLNYGLDYVTRHMGIEQYKNVFPNFDNPLIVLSAVAIFLFFKDLHFRSRVVNYISGLTLGIYIIHEAPLMRNWLWKLFGAKKIGFYETPLYVLKIFAVVVIVFIACAAIEAIRQLVFSWVEKTYHKIKDKKQKSLAA